MSEGPTYVRHFRIFLSSPGDVAEERRIARHVIEEVLPQRPALRGQASYEVVAWDHPAGNAPLAAGLTPQEAINQGLPKPSECDLTLVILWGRMGTPLPEEYRKPDGSRYLSGTEWEFEDARQAKPDSVFIYRRSAPPQLQSGNAVELRQMAEQADRLEVFLDQFRNSAGNYTGNINTYETPAEFRDKLVQHLERIVLHRLSPDAPSSSTDSRLVIDSQTEDSQTEDSQTEDSQTERDPAIIHTYFTLRDRRVDATIGVDILAGELAHLLERMDNEQGSMVGIFGRWGRGKSFLMDQIWEHCNIKTSFSA